MKMVNAGRAELAEIAKQNSPHQIQLINFLLAKGEGDLAHLAIENADLQKSGNSPEMPKRVLLCVNIPKQTNAIFAMLCGSVR